MSKVKQRCRHRRAWVFHYVGSNGAVMWCYECGAIRNVPEDKHWTKPVGIGGENPALKGKG